MFEVVTNRASKIWYEVHDRPLRYVGPGFIAGDSLMTLGGASDSNYYAATAASLGMATNVALIIFGDGGDSNLRTAAQIQRARLAERTIMVGIGISGALYTLGGSVGHRGAVVGGEIFMGCCVAGGAMAVLTKQKANDNGSLREAGRALRCAAFADAARQISCIAPYKKAALLWSASNIGLAAAVWETHNLFFAGAMAIFLMTNRLLATAKRAELKKALTIPQP